VIRKEAGGARGAG